MLADESWGGASLPAVLGGFMSPLHAGDVAEFVDFVATEMSNAASAAVDRWMFEIQGALCDPRLTSLGRLNAIHEIVKRYQTLTGRTEFHPKLVSSKLAS
jgi:hypothetical protein